MRWSPAAVFMLSLIVVAPASAQYDGFQSPAPAAYVAWSSGHTEPLTIPDAPSFEDESMLRLRPSHLSGPPLPAPWFTVEQPEPIEAVGGVPRAGTFILLPGPPDEPASDGGCDSSDERESCWFPLPVRVPVP